MSTSVPYRIIAFHAQQCTETSLKALLVRNNLDFPFTHSISRLVELAAPHVARAEVLADAESLTPYAVTTRYGVSDVPVSEDECRLAVAIAASVLDEVNAVLREQSGTAG